MPDMSTLLTIARRFGDPQPPKTRGDGFMTPEYSAWERRQMERYQFGGGASAAPKPPVQRPMTDEELDLAIEDANRAVQDTARRRHEARAKLDASPAPSRIRKVLGAAAAGERSELQAEVDRLSAAHERATAALDKLHAERAERAELAAAEPRAQAVRAHPRLSERGRVDVEGSEGPIVLGDGSRPFAYNSSVRLQDGKAR